MVSRLYILCVVLCDVFVFSQDWTSSHDITQVNFGFGSADSGNSDVIHQYFKGAYTQQDSPEDTFVSHQEWTSSHDVSDLPVFGSSNNGNSAPFHRFLTGAYMQQRNPEVINRIPGQRTNTFSNQCSFRFQCNDGSCLPRSQVCNGFKECFDGSDEAQNMCSRRKCPLNSFNCGDSCIDLKLRCDGKKDCANGYDESDRVCRSCFPAPRIDNGGVHVDFNIPKTTKEIKEFYTFKIRCDTGFSLGRGNLTCINGTWIGVAPTCLECGKITPSPRRMTPNGDSYQYGVAPWHVGVYSKLKRPYKLICGGALISAKYILSAAQCFWDDAVGLLPAPIFAVTVGKAFSGWDDERDYDAQTSDVDDIKVPELFLGETNNLMYNVAVVTVASQFKFTKYVKPVCINYNDIFAPDLADQKFMVGVWRASIRDKGSQIADTLNVGDCKPEFPSDFTKYITSDKACTAYNGVAVGPVVAGSGLVYQQTRFGEMSYILRGIASFGKDQPNLPTPSHGIIFTNVVEYKTLITEFF